MLQLRKKQNNQARGNVLIITLILTSLFVVGIMTVFVLVSTQNKLASHEQNRELAYQIAEAGFEYYRWHLAHVPDDFTSDTGSHEYKNAFGEVIGYYIIEVTPPSSGSTVVQIKSTGYTIDEPNVKRVIESRMGVPSFARYAVVANDIMRFGEGTEIFGPVHSNGGIRFDGIAHNLVSSSKSQYDDPDHSGAEEYGVHTHVSPTDVLPPAALLVRTDVFQAGRSVGVPAVDFAGITSDLSTLKTLASTGGVYLGASGGEGYHVTFNTNDTIDIQIVYNELRCQYSSGGSWYDLGYCSSNYNSICTQDSQCKYCSGNSSISCSSDFTCSSQGAGTCVTTGVTCVKSTHSIGTRDGDEADFEYNGGSSLNVPLPANGIIFFEDDVWVDGQVDGARVTLVAAREPLASGDADIYVNNDLLYTNYDGTDVIGLVAQTNILVGYFSEDDLRIDAALIAQNGRVSRPYYGLTYSTWRLYPTGGTCTNNPSQACTSSANCNNYCMAYPTRSCTTNANCNNYCLRRTSRSCTTNANCGSYGPCVLGDSCASGDTCSIVTNPDGGTTCAEYRKRSTITTYGALGTNQRYGFAWVGSSFSCGDGQYNQSGYCTRNLNFDSSLIYAPPPAFPTTGQYTLISFEEQ